MANTKLSIGAQTRNYENEQSWGENSGTHVTFSLIDEIDVTVLERNHYFLTQPKYIKTG